jgi:ADP-ribosyl-[dinitrogen reductase] hydrolase
VNPRDRYRGALLGLAAGDALGATLEFRPPGSFQPIHDMAGGGPFGLKAGQWTDDTSMALCLAESLVERGGFDPADQMRRYVRWWREGLWSSTGSCFDIGVTTRSALRRFEETGEPLSGSTDPQSAGNGAIMRLAPVPLAFAPDAERAIVLAGESSLTTHGARTCVDACRFLAGLIVGALRGEGKSELLSPRYTPVPGLWERRPLAPEIDEVAAGSFLRRDPPEIVGSGYVVKSLEAALWAFARSDSFEEGVLLAVNLGDDADTTGAVYGQLAGAYYGVVGIPERWLEKLAVRGEIERVGEGLWNLSSSSS